MRSASCLRSPDKGATPLGVANGTSTPYVWILVGPGVDAHIALSSRIGLGITGGVLFSTMPRGFYIEDRRLIQSPPLTRYDSDAVTGWAGSTFGCGFGDGARPLLPFIIMSGCFAEYHRGRPARMEFKQVYDEHVAFVWRLLRRLGLPESALNDAVQDVFLVVFRRLPDFVQRAKLSTWLFRICMRVAKDYRRRAHVRHEVLDDSNLDVQADSRDDAAAMAERQEDLALFDAGAGQASISTNARCSFSSSSRA